MRTQVALLCVLASLAFSIEPQAWGKDTGGSDNDDPLKNIAIVAAPTDIDGIKAVALKNRQDRIDMIHDSMACIQKSITADDVQLCITTEQKTLQVISLTYCNTNLGIPKNKSSYTSPTGAPPPIGDKKVNGISTDCYNGAAALRGEKLPYLPPVYSHPAPLPTQQFLQPSPQSGEDKVTK